MRAVIVGTSGAGKSTFSRALAARLGLPHVELDALHWGPGWRAATPEAFADAVDAATSAPAWIVDGNYGSVRPLVWGRMTHLVWLDYSRAVIMGRVISRSLRRALTWAELWNGNREDWHRLFHASHPIAWAWTTWQRRRSEFEALLAAGIYPGLTVERLRHPREAAAALDRLARRNPPA